MVLGKASEKGKSMIKYAHEQKTKGSGWAYNKCETALMLASEHQFRNAFAKEFKKDGLKDDVDIPIQDFLDWINYNEVFVKKESGNRKGEPCQEIVIQYVNEDFINPGLPRISLGEIIDNLILSKQKKVRFHNITIPNWKKFLQMEEEIEEDIFAAFWYALGIKEDYQLFFEKIKSDSPYINKLKIQALVSELTAFNHDSQIKVIRQNGINNYKQAFLMVHKCPWRKDWIFQRIAHEIRDKSQLKVEKERIYHKQKNEKLEEIFNRSFPMDYLRKTLNNSYLFLIINIDIDDYNLQQLEVEDFIQNCWQRVLERISGEQKGKILLFLVTEKELGNHWQNSEILQTYVKQIQLKPFTSDDLEDLILSIDSKFSSQFDQKTLKSEEEARAIAQKLLKDCIISGKDINTGKLLNNIVETFNCQYEDLMRQWQTYPHR
ncbi:hypothetical protein [Planktothrix agardhii]|uniref:hypothetical protein n=1 Tax=Planktothrix agardhii TaxID=1160 RepID=UPI002B20138B|nr:hypothetical protein [Planktothrix agardhii]MEA5559806.1 hypothetical protein [Planktothrix agardhii UHCC 0887]